MDPRNIRKPGTAQTTAGGARPTGRSQNRGKVGQGQQVKGTGVQRKNSKVKICEGVAYLGS